MIDTPQDLKALIHDLSVSAWTLATLGALFESGVARELCEPRSARELAERIARIEAELRVEREAHAASRAQAELALANLRAAHVLAPAAPVAPVEAAHASTSPRTRWPLWFAIASLAASIAFASLWLDARIASSHRTILASMSASLDAMASRVDEHLGALSTRLDDIERIARGAAAAAAAKPATTSSSSPPPRSPRPTQGTSTPKPPAPTPIKPCGTGSPLGCLDH